MKLKKNLIAFALTSSAMILSSCGGDGRHQELNTLPQVLAAAQGDWQSPSGCQVVSGSSQVGSYISSYRFSGTDFIETITYYSDAYCAYGAVVHTSVHESRIGAVGPDGYGNQVDFFLRRTTLRPLSSSMAADYNYDGSCGMSWYANVEQDVSQYAYCPIYDYSSSTQYTYEMGELYRQIIDVDGNEVYFGVPNGSSYPIYYSNTPTMVR